MEFLLLSLATWLKQGHEAFYEQINRTVMFLTSSENRTRLGFVATHPNGAWLDGTFLPAYMVYTSAYSSWRDPSTRTPIIVRDLEDAEKAIRLLYKVLREILSAAPYVSNSDLLAMALPERSGDSRKPAPVARVYPVIVALTTMLRHLIFNFFTMDSENKPRKHKPDGQHGVEVCWVISSAPVVNTDDLVHSAFSTTTELDLPFTGDDRGKTVYFAARWENTRGEKGPWSPIESAIIP
jgi:hypothetical protein